MPTLKIPLSKQATALLDELASCGIYGQTPEEVAGRFIDQRLIDICNQGPTPFFKDLQKVFQRIIRTKRKRR